MTSINLGKVVNKYIIMDIFLSAGEEDAKIETEEVLWAQSKRHRNFFAINFDWYPRFLTEFAPWKIISTQSNLLFREEEKAKSMLDRIRIDGQRKVKKVNRIYTAS